MTAAASTHLVIADDHPLFRDALRQAVASVVTSAKIDEAGSFEELTALLEQDSDVDLVLLDLTMPGISGFSGLIYLRAHDAAGTRRPGVGRAELTLVIADVRTGQVAWRTVARGEGSDPWTALTAAVKVLTPGLP